MEFRKDIEGLRSVAILSILIFHIDSRFSGGFVGVDIFFVISGFLITGVIWRDLNNGHFSISHFYLKRIRRLFPALLIMLVIVFFGVAYSEINAEISMYGKSSLASLYYVSNFFFNSQNGYFSGDLKFNPLLHTWSLSVEEQFYLFFPLLMILLIRFKKNRLIIILIVFVISFLLSEALVIVDETAAFFLSPSRFWQFLTGSLIAIYGYKISLQNKSSDLIGIIGSILISLSLWFFSKDTLFPGVMAAIPTFGSALLIIAGKCKASYTHKLLSSTVPVFIGKISYSLYLWHWPIIVLYKLNVAPLITREDKVILFVISIVAGYLSWKFVEQTTRKITLKNSSPILLRYSVASLAVVTSLSLTAVYFAEQLSDQQRNHFAAYNNYTVKARSGKCFLHSRADDANLFNYDLCVRIGDSKNILLIGDSHAAHYYNSLKLLYPDYNVSQVTSSGCRPVINTKGKERCTKLVTRAFSEIIEEDFQTIILAARWQKDDAVNINKTITYLEDKVNEIIVIGPVIEYEQSLPSLLSRFYIDSAKESLKISLARKYEDRLNVDNAIRNACSNTKAKYVSALKKLCPDKQCVTVSNNTPVQFDYGHLTDEGSKIVLKGLFEL